MKTNDLLIGAAVGAIVVGLLWLLNSRRTSSSREGFFQAPPAQQDAPVIAPDSNLNKLMDANPQTCALMISVKERLTQTLQKATDAKDNEQIKLMTTSLNSINDELRKMKCIT